MGIGSRKIKTEMKGTGGGRWMPRADAKRTSKKARREEASRQVRETEPVIHPAEERLIDNDVFERGIETPACPRCGRVVLAGRCCK